MWLKSMPAGWILRYFLQQLCGVRNRLERISRLLCQTAEDCASYSDGLGCMEYPVMNDIIDAQNMCMLMM